MANPNTQLSPATSRRPAGRRPSAGGFTLIELLVVMTIIILMVAAAVPAVRYIVGSRSTESATNVVSAILGRARSEAIQQQRTKGVFFFLDPDTDLTTMVIVQGGFSPELSQYTAWTDGQLEFRKPRQTKVPAFQYYASNVAVGPSAVTAMIPLTSLPLATQTKEFGPFRLQQWFLQKYSCNTQHTPATITPYSVPASPNPPFSPQWASAGDRFIELSDSAEFQTLPSGVALQVINDPKNLASGERYLRTSCILFDSIGRFQSVPWAVAPTSRLGVKLKLGTTGLDGPGGTASLCSGFGVVVYDREIYKNVKQFTDNGMPYTFSTGAGENDAMFSTLLPNISDTSVADEVVKEKWLDVSTLPLVVNRQNGTLIKGE